MLQAIQKVLQVDMVAHAYKPSILEAEMEDL
jgi:hypothetical protein